MPKLNLDEFSAKLFEPIEVTIGGKVYTVPTVTAEVLDKLTSAAKEEKTTSLCRQLSDILGVDKNTFVKTDIRQIVEAIRFISDNITKGMEADPKNFNPAGENTLPQSSTPSPAASPSTI